MSVILDFVCILSSRLPESFIIDDPTCNNTQSQHEGILENEMRFFLFEISIYCS